MEDSAVVAVVCVALLIWIRSTVPDDKRTALELRLLALWHLGVLAVLTRVRDWLRRL
jgi:hypothetical protein